MKNSLLLCLCCLLLSCSNSSMENNNTQKIALPSMASKLNISLNITQPEFKLGMPVTIRFILKNNEAEKVTFCKLNSPAHEGISTNCFEIKDEQGNLIPFIGTSATYAGAIQESDKITIEAAATKIYWVDLRTVYQLDKPGKYSIRFVGDAINGLTNSHAANFLLI